ncbi:MAG: lipase family protein [Candidatus Kariarchaeaceae archaeon]|jgi:hypothetical protein
MVYSQLIKRQYDYKPFIVLLFGYSWSYPKLEIYMSNTTPLELISGSITISKLIKEASKIDEGKKIDLEDYTNVIAINNKKTDTQVLMATRDRILYIAFPGTQGAHDASIDLQFKLRNFDCKSWFKRLLNLIFQRKDEIQVHEGFRKASCSVRTDINNAVLTYITQNITNKTFKIIIGGHSLGGALATLTTINIKKTFGKCRVLLYTFGSPPVGNSSFKELHGSLINLSLRIVNKNDPVPYLLSNEQGYVHVDQFVGIDENLEITETETIDHSQVKAALNLIGNLILGQTPKDHKMDEYISRIEKLLQLTE